MLCVAAEPGFAHCPRRCSSLNPLRDQSTFGRVSRHWSPPPPLVVVEDWSPVRRFGGHMQMDLASVATAASASQRAAACPGQRGAAARSSRPLAGLRRAPTAAAMVMTAVSTRERTASRASSESNLEAARGPAARRRRRSARNSFSELLPRASRPRWPRPGAPRRPSGRSPATRCSPCGATPGLRAASRAPLGAARGRRLFSGR